MFVRTERLLLRPGWADDAPALQDAITHETVAQMLSRMPWPYDRADAEAFLSQPYNPRLPECLVFLRTAGKPRLIGGIGLGGTEQAPELGFWVSPAYWGLGFATEAGRAFLSSARETLRTPRVTAHHFIDNPASGHVLRKLGFERTGRVTPLHSQGRGADVPALEYVASPQGEKAAIALEAEMRRAPLLAA